MLKIVLIFKLFILSSMSIANNLYDFSFTNIDGKSLKLEKFKNKVVLVVNTASMCGLTKQLQTLENVYQNYKDKGLVIVGVPSKVLCKSIVRRKGKRFL